MATTRERILDVAAELFVDQGYENTSLREIADRLGFTKAALYYHFPSKEQILQALLEPLGELQEEVARDLEQATSIEEWADGITHIVEVLFDNLRPFRIMLRNRNVIEMLGHTYETMDEHRRWHDRVGAAIERLGRTTEERVRMVCALGAVGGFDDFGGEALLTGDPHELRTHLVRVVREILGVPAGHAPAAPVTSRR